MITATLAGDTVKTLGGATQTWNSVEAAVSDMAKAYPNSLDAIEIERDGKVVAYLF